MIRKSLIVLIEHGGHIIVKSEAGVGGWLNLYHLPSHYRKRNVMLTGAREKNLCRQGSNFTYG